MSRSKPPRPRSSGQASRRPLLLIVGGVLLLAVGLALGWLLFGRDQDLSRHESAPVVTATSVVVAGSPTVQPFDTESATAATIPTSTPIPATSPPTVTPALPATSSLLPPNLARLQAQAIDLINQSRAAEGLFPVAWDAAAAQVAQAHAEDMLQGPFFSHWNRDGYGPDHRAALDAGMTDAVFENIYTFWRRTSDGQPAPIEDWPQRILDAHLGLMDSPGHRRNIMDPAHTHVGIGIAYRPEIGELRLVQLFVNRYVELDPLPAELPVGTEVEISGRLLDGASDVLINLAYEPFPQPMSLDQLNATSSYQPAARFFSAPRTTVEGDRFRSRAILDFEGQPGLYHVWIFINVEGERVMAASSIVVVR